MLDEKKIFNILQNTKKITDENELQNILNKAKALATKPTKEFNQTISLNEIFKLLSIDSNNTVFMQKLFQTALDIKKKIYGNRIVLFAPLYASNYCKSSCLYCSFRADNTQIKRKLLSDEEVISEVKALQSQGHRRIVMLMGDHPKYSLDDFIRHLNIAANVKSKPFGAIRRINVEIPSLADEEFKKLKDTNHIGTYLLFQETYHRETYKKMHPFGPKSDYDYRYNTMKRAIKANIDDVGMGVLFGLYDYKFEVLALLEHARSLDEEFAIGPHTISVPRIKEAINTPCSTNPPYPVSDADFKKIVGVIRIALPYTGIILSTREPPYLRKDLINLGVSQISAGSKTSVGGYNKDDNNSNQFSLSDERSLNEMIFELVKFGYIPSWCTACYRSKRTGKAFMEIAKKGNIQNLCHPNALITFYEYLLDYADERTKKIGLEFIEKQMQTISDTKKTFLIKAIEKIKNDKRDIFI